MDVHVGHLKFSRQVSHIVIYIISKLIKNQLESWRQLHFLGARDTDDDQLRAAGYTQGPQPQWDGSGGRANHGLWHVDARVPRRRHGNTNVSNLRKCNNMVMWTELWAELFNLMFADVRHHGCKRFGSYQHEYMSRYNQLGLVSFGKRML